MAQLKVVSRYLPGGTEESQEDVSHDSRCRDRDLNWVSPEYGSEALPLEPTCSVAPCEKRPKYAPEVGFIFLFHTSCFHISM
jgi:hypothetical protein